MPAAWTPARAHPLNRGLAAWYLPTPARWGGPTVPDLWGGLDAAISGYVAPAWSPPDHPSGLGQVYVDGTGHLDSPLVLGAEFTLALFVRIVANNSVYPMIARAGGGPDLEFGWTGSRFFCSGATYIPGDFTEMSDGLWHHFALTASTSAASTTLYIDGVPRGSVAQGIDASGTLAIGNAPGGGLGWFGPIRDFRAFSRALSAAEVATEYSSAALGYPGALVRRRPRPFSATSPPPGVPPALAALRRRRYR